MILVLRRVVLVATPLTLAVVLWFHPPGGENVYQGLREDVDAWRLVHTVFLPFILLMAIAAYLLLHGLQGSAATVSRRPRRRPPMGALTPANRFVQESKPTSVGQQMLTARWRRW